MQIDRAIGSIREDRRADYLYDTKAASDAVGCHPNKFGDWWRRTREKLIDLAAVQPGETAAEVACIFAKAAELRDRRRESR